MDQRTVDSWLELHELLFANTSISAAASAGSAATASSSGSSCARSASMRPRFDARIVNQYALFSVVSTPGTRLEELAQRIVIPAGLKWEVRDKLDRANITERVLFPGLDGISRWLARYYAPRT